MQNDIPNLAQYAESAQHYSREFARALTRHDHAGLTEAQWGLIAKGAEAVPYARSLLNHEDYEARAAGASILGWVGKSAPRKDDIALAIVEAIYHELQRPEPEDGHEREALDAMVQALGQLGGPKIVSTLGRLINDPNVNSAMVWTTVEALDEIIDRPLVEEGNLVTAVQQWLLKHS